MEMTRCFFLKVLATGALLIALTVQTVQAAPVIMAKLKANPSSYDGKCPATIKFDGEIIVRGITRGPLTVNYEFLRSDGARDSQPKKLIFYKDGSQQISTAWTLGGEKLPTFTGWQAVKVTAPIQVESSKANFSVKCLANSSKTEPVDDFKPELTKFEEKPLHKLPARLSPAERDLAMKFKLNPAAVQHIVKVDLTCQIKAYYDQAHTKPVQEVGPNMGIYHISMQQSPPRPLPYYAFFNLMVRNNGLVSPAPNVTNRVFFTSQPPFSPPKQIISPPETFSPGEAIEYKYWWGPFTSLAVGLHNEIIFVQTSADFPPRVNEDNEGNNNCSYQLKFVYP
jgi:hypothetical protein